MYKHFFSPNTPAGINGINHIFKHLEESNFGILFITPNNLKREWINFEAGAISKGIESNRVVPLMFDKAETHLNKEPIGNFQYLKFDYGGVLNLIQNMSKVMQEYNGNSEGQDNTKNEIYIENRVKMFWSQLESEIENIKNTSINAKDSEEPEELNELEDWKEKINEIASIINFKSISAQETYNQNVVYNWPFGYIDQLLRIFNDIYI